MSEVDDTIVPVWTLSTVEGATIPVLAGEGPLGSERLAELRSALAAFASAPLVTLEAHPLPSSRGRSSGLPLAATSPLAKELSRLVTKSSNAPAVAQIAQPTEVLYRMHVPAKVASQFGQGMVKLMPSKSVKGAVYGNLMGPTGIVAKPSFVPVEVAAAGAKGPAVGAAARAAAGGAAVTMAAPLVLMAVAVAASAYADQQRQEAIQGITELLEKLHSDNLESERSALDGCRDAIDKATTLLLDRGRVGASLGLDSAVHAISTATRKAETRVDKWEAALSSIDGDRVDAAELEATFPGITGEGGEFRAHLELAALAIALKRRVIVLQGVEAAQDHEGNPFENFLQSLRDDQQRIADLEGRVERVLRRLSALELRSPKRLIDKVMTRKQVDNLLETSYRLRAFAPASSANSTTGDVVIEIERHVDGSLHVLPASGA